MKLEMKFCAKNQEAKEDRGEHSLDFIRAKFVLPDATDAADATIFFDSCRGGVWSEEMIFCDLDYADLKAIKAFAEAAMARCEFENRTEFDSAD